MSMIWTKLLSEDRFYWPRTLSDDHKPEIENRSWVFQQDATRISSSSAFRRLQAKTQVLPFPKTDYPRSRLTHTIEVSNIGRRLALNIARALISEHAIARSDSSIAGNPDFIWQFVEVTAAACLAHDIGNPPFGHAGEDAIKLWCDERFNKSHQFEQLKQSNCEELQDVARFDGNAQGYHILTCLQGWREHGGLQLSLAVLGAFSKYPRTVEFADRDKFGVMHAHREEADFVFKELGLIKKNSSENGFEYCRHPIAYLVEAADDIAYITADLEDAVRGGVLKFETAERALLKIASRSGYDKDQKERMKRYKDLANESQNAKLRYLRTHAITEMVREAELTFLDNYTAIMDGAYHKILDKSTNDIRRHGELLKDSHLSDQVREIKSMSSKEIHDAKGKIENEVAGKNILFGLLDMFADVLDKYLTPNASVAEIDRKLAMIFPWDNYFDIEGKTIEQMVATMPPNRSLYMLIDFVSGMTDRYASSMFRQLSGHQQPFANW